MNGADLIDGARLALGGVVVCIGLALMLGGAIGVLRFPDVYTRLHAVRVSDTLGAAVLVLGLAITAGDAAIFWRLLLLAALLAALGPLFSHLLGGAAHGGGLAPRVGAYAAPRPGVRSAERER